MAIESQLNPYSLPGYGVPYNAAITEEQFAIDDSDCESNYDSDEYMDWDDETPAALGLCSPEAYAEFSVNPWLCADFEQTRPGDLELESEPESDSPLASPEAASQTPVRPGPLARLSCHLSDMYSAVRSPTSLQFFQLRHSFP